MMPDNLLQYVSDAVIATDLAFKITSWNRAAERIYDWQADEVMGKLLNEVVPVTYLDEKQEAVLAKFWQDGYWEGDVIHYRKDGTPLNMSVSITMVRDSAGQPVGTVAVNRDMTGHKRAETEVRRLNEELEQRVIRRTAQLEATNEELESFSYAVSHDLRAPLRHINGFAKLLRRRGGAELDPGLVEYVDLIIEAADKMNELIDALLAFSRISRAALKIQALNLGDLVEEVRRELMAAPHLNDRRLVWRISPLPTVQADPTLLRRVIVNLLSNAIKFTDPRSEAHIEIGLLPVDSRKTIGQQGVTIFVRDNGVGFDMKHSQKLFGMFQRLHTADEFEGTGVGLATVRRIIQRHGGQVWAESEPDKGATFYFTLIKGSYSAVVD